MKLKFLILAAVIFAIASCGPSYRVTDKSTVGVTVPASIQTSFSSQYPQASDVTWGNYDAANLPIDWELSGWPTLDQTAYVATFNMDDNRYYAWYDANGNWIGSAYSMTDFKTLPSAINTTISDKFPGYTIAAVNEEMKKNGVAYEIQLKNGDNKTKLVIDENGNIIKQKAKE